MLVTIGAVFSFATFVTFILVRLRIYIMSPKYHTQDVITTYNQHQATVMLANFDVGDIVGERIQIFLTSSGCW